jgi:hypothetical protein
MEDRVALQRTGRSHRQVVARSDVRWLLVWLAVFAASILTLLAAHQVYRMTGPHPQVTVLIRKLKHHARWLIPGLKGRRSQLVPVPTGPEPPHYAGSSSTNGQVAQRAKT